MGGGHLIHLHVYCSQMNQIINLSPCPSHPHPKTYQDHSYVHALFTDEPDCKASPLSSHLHQMTYQITLVNSMGMPYAAVWAT